MLPLYLIITAVLLSTYCRPIAVFFSWFIAVFYLPVIFIIMYCTCIPAVSIKCRWGRRHESRGECHGNAFNPFAPVVLLGPSGPWLH